MAHKRPSTDRGKPELSNGIQLIEKGKPEHANGTFAHGSPTPNHGSPTPNHGSPTSNHTGIYTIVRRPSLRRLNSTLSNASFMTHGGSSDAQSDRRPSCDPYSTDPERQAGDEAKDERAGRGTWGSRAEFVLSCIGLSVGLGNVWRFPYMAYENGGGAFMIAYLTLQLFIGQPLYFMELVMGQFAGKGPTKIWDFNPAARGIGVSMCIVSLIVSIYYNVIMAYNIYYFFASMQGTLPWSVCKDDWRLVYKCVDKHELIPPKCNENNTINRLLEACTCTGNVTIDKRVPYTCTKPIVNATSAAELFFYKEVIQRSEGIDPVNLGKPIWKLTLCLLLSWVIVVFSLIKGIKTSGKIVYFSGIVPYAILVILMVRTALLEGAEDGIRYFIFPEWRRIADIQVWIAATGQMFFSLSVSYGGVIMFSSYNRFKNKVDTDSLIISIVDLITSFIAGFVVFATFGWMAKTVGKNITDVAKSGYGLAFVVYPEALSNLPPSQLWCCLFFLMLFSLGLDSEFGMLETVLTCIHDEYPRMRRYKSHLCVGIGIVGFFIAIPCTCPGGDYVVRIMDHYGSDFSVLFLACFETISVMWVYGVMRFHKDVQYMLGARYNLWPYWVFGWSVSTPVLLALLFSFRMIDYKAPQYPDDKNFPEFAQIIGWVLFSIALLPVPLWFFWRIVKALWFERIRDLRKFMDFMFSPTSDWTPHDGRVRYRLLVDGPSGDVHIMAEMSNGQLPPIYETTITQISLSDNGEVHHITETADGVQHIHAAVMVEESPASEVLKDNTSPEAGWELQTFEKLSDLTPHTLESASDDRSHTASVAASSEDLGIDNPAMVSDN